MIAQLERVAGFARDDTAETRWAKLRALLARSEASEEATALLAALLSIPAGGRYRLPGTSPQRLREKTLAALLDLFAGLVAREPALALFEDLHWSDPTTLELLARTVARVASMPVLLLMTARPEFKPPWPDQAHVNTLLLNRLSDDDAATLADQVAGVVPLPSRTRRRIVRHTEGVPLFVEELTKAVLESGHLAEDESSAPPPVPTSLHDLLLARLDHLGPARDLAQIGAVIGREFSFELLSAIADQPAPTLEPALARIVRAGLLLQSGTPPEARYAFKHALAQDAAYGMLLRGQRQQLHVRIGKALETRYDGVEAARPEVLAHHFTEAGQIERALGCLLDAGKQALQWSGMVEAEALLRRGLALLPRLSDDSRRQEHELDLQLALGRALIATESWGAPTVGEGFARARELCDGLTRTRKMLPILYGQFVHHALRADFVVAERLAAEMRHLGEEQEDVVTRVMAYRVSGYASLALGDYSTARAYLERSLALYDPADRLRYTELSPQNILPTLLLIRPGLS